LCGCSAETLEKVDDQPSLSLTKALVENPPVNGAAPGLLLLDTLSFLAHVLAVIPSTLAEWGFWLAVLAAGYALYVLGNRFFGHECGGKRLVIFGVGVGFCVGAYLLANHLSKSAEPPVAGAIVCLTMGAIGIPLIFVSFASQRTVEKVFEAVLRAF
jgi:hypothetical protein